LTATPWTGREAAFAEALRDMWGRVRDRFEWRELPEAEIYELTEAREY